MSLPILRPAREADLPDLIRLSEHTAYGMTSMPRNPAFLEKKIQRSLSSFASKPDANQKQTYLFFLEWEGRVVGTSGITAHVGMDEPFYVYHLLHEQLRCPRLNIDRESVVLHFINAPKHPSEIGTLFLSIESGLKGMGKLLSLSRFLFIASFRSRFADTIIAELRGVNEEGVAPFWEAVGRPFFQIDFPQADLLRTQYYPAIEELFPRRSLYVDLLPEAARSVIGVPHANSIGALKILEKQGFKKSSYIDLFDAGPHLFAPTDTIHTVEASSVAPISEVRSSIDETQKALISNMRIEFRATLAPILIEEGHLIISSDVARALQVDVGDSVRYLPL